MTATTTTPAADLWEVNTRGEGDMRGRSVAVVGAGLAGLVTAMELLDAGANRVEVYDVRPFAGGKVGAWRDKEGNHIEMGLHVFFGCYYNVFDVMAKTGALKHLLLKDHVHTFVNKDARVGSLDFRLGSVGAPFNGLKAFAGTKQLGLVDKIRNAVALGQSVIVKGLVDFDGAMKDIRALDDVSFKQWFLEKGGSQGSIERMWDPIAYALGFIDCENMSARCMLTIFQLFAARSEASVLRMLEGSPDRFLTAYLVRYIEERGGVIKLKCPVREVLYTDMQQHDDVRVTGLRVANGNREETVQADVYVIACDVGGAKRLIPGEWKQKFDMFGKMEQLKPVPVVTVQLRFDGWVTELQDNGLMERVGEGKGYGLNNLLYTPDAEFSCFADLAVTSPTDYYKEGEGSLLQLVLTPGDEQMKRTNEDIVERTLQQVLQLFPSAKKLTCTWSSVVKLGESLYREEPGKDGYRPAQETDVSNLFLAGSYTYQDYIDSMEGAVKSGRLAARKVVEKVGAVSAA